MALVAAAAAPCWQRQACQLQRPSAQEKPKRVEQWWPNSSSAPLIGILAAQAASQLQRCGTVRPGRTRVAAVSRPAPSLPGTSRPYESSIDADQFLGNDDANVFKFKDADGDTVRLERQDVVMEVFVNGDSIWAGNPKLDQAGGRLHCGDGYCDVPVHEREKLRKFLGTPPDEEASADEGGSTEEQVSGDTDDFDWVASLKKE
mmetsp:Transcript_108986/g.216460  ORF Transcript_108986/g.216460 Transcript_108986/m.216460 type:complete len:203 (+) Transcript_108986:50-658(+)|eukprot:CAMPEP_0172871768 /NCGR_PEP_ID=MMETSP1075-20121228/92272_1 /TAXON_ID=2916 /ORGANISM="Ceratium fusus, Strain PA161109" /LENGTH=202 /DNA_ID=CAMNT_0013722047 /DNA_START=38 /DNA_END=646 /DNA_ORIENTATION=-